MVDGIEIDGRSRLLEDASVRVVRGDRRTENWLVTTAIGGDYLDRWELWVKRFWERYAERHGYGIAVVIGDIYREGEHALDGSWQKLLAPRELRDQMGRNVRCAMWDTDLVPSPVAPPIFDAVPRGSIGVVSQEHGLPGDAALLRKRIAYLRNRFMSPDFPLWSALNARPEQRFEWAGLPPQDDFFCAGMYVVDSELHADLLADWYAQAPMSEEYRDFSSDELWMNVKAQESGLCEWLPYQWHALWIFEVAAHYPFLYADGVGSEVASWCFASSINRNNIVHLAGRWESSLLGNRKPDFPETDGALEFIEALAVHQEMPGEPVPRGRIRPPV